MFTVLMLTQAKEADYLLCALDSLERHTSNKYEVMIWDNGSTDNTQELINGWMDEGKYGITKYFRHESNIGISKPYNTIFKEANFENVFISDNDFYFLPNWDCLLDDVQAHEYGWSQPHLIEESRPSRSIMDYYGWHPCILMEDILLYNYEGDTYPFDHKANFMPAMMTKKAYWDIGGYNEEFPLNESDFLIRAHFFYKNLGIERLCNNKSFIYHFRGINRGQFGKNSPRPPGDYHGKMIASIEKRYGKSIGELDEEVDFYGPVK